jgi:hypothetical protein
MSLIHAPSDNHYGIKRKEKPAYCNHGTHHRKRLQRLLLIHPEILADKPEATLVNTRGDG